MPALSLPESVKPNAMDDSPPAWPTAADVLRSLKDRANEPTAPSALAGLFLAVISLGLVPAILWPMRFKRVAEKEQEIFRLLARWARTRGNEREANRLKDSADSIRVTPALFAVALVLVLATAMMLLTALLLVPIPHTDWPLTAVTNMTYRVFATASDDPRSYDAQKWVFMMWSSFITVVYFAHLLQVHLYARQVRQFLDRFNALVIHEGFAPVYLKPIGWGASPVWLGAALAMLLIGAVWGVPMAIAGATDRRYRRHASCLMKVELVARIKNMALSNPERERVGNSNGGTYRCPTPGCHHESPKKAKFCPHCGNRRMNE